MRSDGAQRHLVLASLAATVEVAEAGIVEAALPLVVVVADRTDHLIKLLRILDMTQAHPTTRTVSLPTTLAGVAALITLHTGAPRLHRPHPQIRTEEMMADTILTVRDMVAQVHMSKIRGVKVR